MYLLKVARRSTSSFLLIRSSSVSMESRTRTTRSLNLALSRATKAARAEMLYPPLVANHQQTPQRGTLASTKTWWSIHYWTVPTTSAVSLDSEPSKHREAMRRSLNPLLQPKLIGKGNVSKISSNFCFLSLSKISLHLSECTIVF